MKFKVDKVWMWWERLTSIATHHLAVA